MPELMNANRIQRLERLIDVSRSLATCLELDSLLKYVIDAACELTESQGASILLYEEETDLLKFIAGTPSDKETLKRVRVPLEKSLAGQVYSQSKPLVLNQASKDTVALHGLERALNLDIRSILAVPMIFQGETIGVMEAVNRLNATPYTEDDVTILETLSAQASIALLSSLMLEEMKSAYSELEEMERQKTDFIAIASHELRTPVGLILGHSTYLVESIEDVALRQQVEVILRSAMRLKKIVEDMSNINNLQSEKGRLHHKAIPIGKLVQNVVVSFQKKALSRKVHLAVDLGNIDQAVIDGDGEKICVALGNLIENALDFTQPNGHVLVAMEKLPGYVKVSVMDDGIGIPAKDLSRIFDRFYQVESHLTRRHGGMGLGLPVAKAMIEMHHGQIWVESIEGRGSSFSFLLPARGEKPGASTAAFETDTLSKPFG